MTEETIVQPPEKPVEQFITGYQYGADMSFIGAYEFPVNLDQESVHMPPRTTLLAPPNGLLSGKEAAFDVVTGVWAVRDEDLSWMDADTRARYLALAVQAGAGDTPGEVAP